MRLPKVLRFPGIFASLFLLAAAALHAQVTAGNNIGGSLKRLIEVGDIAGFAPDSTHSRLAYSPRSGRYQLTAGKPTFLADNQRRVLIRIVLEGGIATEDISKQVEGLGGKMMARNQALHNNLVSAYLPLNQVRTLATLPGVKALHLETAPVLNVGAVTSQAVKALGVGGVLRAGYDGTGVTVGILSDSYNNYLYEGSPATALVDVQTGDLPNTTRIRDEEGLKYAIDYNGYGGDEGRAIAQIIHDMAPGADLCFATADFGEQAFAEFIVDMRINKKCGANIIVDDVFYYDEPFFSDGVVAQAVNQVAWSKALPGKPVSYFSSAGNNSGGGSYSSTFRPVTPAAAKKLAGSPVDLTTIPASVDISGGLHNFNPDPSGPASIAQQVQLSGSNAVIFQWDDLFNQGAITTDYNLLVFDSDGKYDATLSSVDDNFASDEAVEGFFADASSPTTFYFVITRTGAGAHEADHIKYINLANGGGSITGQYVSGLDAPVAVGHSAAEGAISVAAYNANRAPFNANPPYIPEIESYTSVGPAFIAFDGLGKRLPQLQVRSKPDVACVDGVFTTFFGQFVLASDQYPRFFGTSAAAPCAAGIGALMLEKSKRPGGPGALTPVAMVDLLKQAGPARSLDPFTLASVEEVGSGGFFGLTLTGSGYPYLSPTQFAVSFVAPGKTLYSLTLAIPEKDVAAFYLDTRPTDTYQYPLLIGPSSPGVFVRSTKPSSDNARFTSPTLTLFFGGFESGDTFQFGAVRLDTSNSQGYFDVTADRINGTKYVAIFTDKTKVEGTLTQKPHYGYSIYDGHGVIDAKKAVGLVP